MLVVWTWSAFISSKGTDPSQSWKEKKFNTILGASRFSTNLQLNRCCTGKYSYSENIQNQNSKECLQHCGNPFPDIAERHSFPTLSTVQSRQKQYRWAIKAWRRREFWVLETVDRFIVLEKCCFLVLLPTSKNMLEACGRATDLTEGRVLGWH